MTKAEMAMGIIKSWAIMGSIFMLLRFIVGVIVDRSRWKKELAYSAMTWLVSMVLIIVICAILAS